MEEKKKRETIGEKTIGANSSSTLQVLSRGCILVNNLLSSHPSGTSLGLSWGQGFSDLLRVRVRDSLVEPWPGTVVKERKICFILPVTS